MFGYLAYIFVALFYVFMLKVECAEILAVFPHPNPARYLVAHAYLRALANRGHNITLITHNFENINLTQFRHIEIEYEEFNKLINSEDREVQEKFLSNMHTKISRIVLENPEVEDLMSEENRRFDLVVLDVNMPSALFALGPHFNAHLIGISATPGGQEIDNLVGNVSPVSTVPAESSGYIGPMNIFQRIQNLKLFVLEWIKYYIFEWFPQQRLFVNHFPNLKVSFSEVYKNFSLVLANHHFSIDIPRPLVPNMVEIAGMHIPEKAAALPKDLQVFLDEADKGAIYFSMGTLKKIQPMTVDALYSLMLFFALDTKMRVLIKLEDPTGFDIDKERMIVRKWFPQREILAHPNLKLFITHNGYLTFLEAIYHAKPVIILQNLYDDNKNAQRVERFGIGMKLPIERLSEKMLIEAVNKIVNNKTYTENCQKIQQRFKDRPVKPLRLAVFWTEFMIRHNGATFMRVLAKDMSFREYHNVDLWFILIAFILFCSCLFAVALRTFLLYLHNCGYDIQIGPFRPLEIPVIPNRFEDNRLTFLQENQQRLDELGEEQIAEELRARQGQGEQHPFQHVHQRRRRRR